MLNPSAPAFDAPQTFPSGPPSYHQTQEWYEGQQTTSCLTDVRPSGKTLFFHAYSYDQPTPSRDFALLLRSLQQQYTILDSNNVLMIELAEKPALYPLLIEAVRPLQEAFGEGRMIHVRVQVSDDDSFLKVAVRLPASFCDPEHARSFDAAWWLNNCHRSGGSLVFDYEIQDGL